MSLRRIRVASLGLLALPLVSKAALADDLVVFPSRSGVISAWLGTEAALPAINQNMDRDAVRAVDGSLHIARGSDIGGSRKLRIIATADERFDLKRDLHPDRQAVLASVLRAREDAKLLLLVNTDDGIAVTLDQSTLYLRDKARTRGLDDDVIALDLPKGDHNLVIHLHQKSSEWTVRTRLVDQLDGLAPRDVSFVLPQVPNDESVALAQKLASIDLQLAVSQQGYSPSLLVRFAGGMPALTKLPVSAKCVVKSHGASTDLFQLQLGEIARDSRSPFDFRASLPLVSPQDIKETDGGVLSCEVDFAGRKTVIDRASAKSARESLAKIDLALAQLDSNPQAKLSDPQVLRSTLRLARTRLEGFISSGDSDASAIVEEAAFVDRFLSPLFSGQDPIQAFRGPARLAYNSILDGADHPFGLYLPPTFGNNPQKTYPLVVVLHGLNGQPMQMIRWFFGRDDGAHNGYWEDRHWGQLPDLDAIVVSPSGFGNLGYRDSGEVDIMTLRDWAIKTFPVDTKHVYVTGPSMGGIGSGAVALRYADHWGAAAPLCGYHSFFLRNDMQGRRRRYWEDQQAEFWSNAYWAENGLNLPLLIVHGKKDLPEANSGVLIDRYKHLGYSMEHEHPDAGHDVWQRTYEDFKAFHWLMRHEIDPEPRKVVLRAASLRYADNFWVHVRKLAHSMDWADVTASVVSKDRIDLTVQGATQLHLDRPKSRLDDTLPLRVHLDGTDLTFNSSENIDLHLEGDSWAKGELPPPSGLSKSRGLSGPLRDIYLEPLVFVYGTQDPALARINYEVARSLAEPSPGVEIKWSVVADSEVDEPLANSHSLFLIGTPKTNSYLRAIDPQLPIHVDGDAVVVGDKKYTGEDLGTVFIYPNPQSPSHYVAVAGGPSPGGMMRVLSLPRFLPDYAVYDLNSEARSQIVLGSAAFLDGGNFDEAWRIGPDSAEPDRSDRRSKKPRSNH
jgi:hypothetical protein